MRGDRIPVFAVVRIDGDFDDPARDARLLRTEPGLLISVVSVWPSEELAEAETIRLNELNSGKGMKYFWQLTRFTSGPK